MITLLNILVVILLFVDYRQTLDIKNHAGDYEINLILGKHPSDIRVSIYFLIVTLLFTIVIWAVPIVWACLWTLGWTIVEGWAIINNIKLGLKI